MLSIFIIFPLLKNSLYMWNEKNNCSTEKRSYIILSIFHPHRDFQKNPPKKGTHWSLVIIELKCGWRLLVDDNNDDHDDYDCVSAMYYAPAISRLFAELFPRAASSALLDLLFVVDFLAARCCTGVLELFFFYFILPYFVSFKALLM